MNGRLVFGRRASLLVSTGVVGHALWTSAAPVLTYRLWGHQVPTLAESHRVIVMDSRGHGRSTRNSQPGPSSSMKIRRTEAALAARWRS
jgi:pimeloyl-ACP methyl ester carboxylesterase